jgi:hypothetical protein
LVTCSEGGGGGGGGGGGRRPLHLRISQPAHFSIKGTVCPDNWFVFFVNGHMT